MGKYGILDEDKVEGLYYVRARYYDAQTGRFLTQDPIWSTNLYPYANNNPISNVDVNGKSYLSILGDELMDYSVDLAKENKEILEQQYIDEYLVYGDASFQTKFLLSTNSIWENPWSRNGLLFLLPSSKGRGFSTLAGKTVTKIIGKTGLLKLLKTSTKDGRLLKDFGDYIYVETKNEIIIFIKNKFK